MSSTPYFFVSFSRTLTIWGSSRTMMPKCPERSVSPLFLEHCEELVFAQLKEGVAFAFVELFEIEDVLVEGDRLFDVADLDGDVIAAINFDTHRSTLFHL